MRLAMVAIATALAWSACSLAEPARPVPVPVQLGKSFSLTAGASAATGDGMLQLGFEAVQNDSRCPKGEQCVRAGDATVRIWVQHGSGPRQTRELHLAAGAGQAMQVQEHELRLLRLDPHPVTGRPIAAADYVATFTWSRAARADPER